MPRPDNFQLDEPIFSEPIFNEAGDPTPDPSQFLTPHPSDSKLYRQIQDLLKKDVVSFDQMGGQPGDLFTLASALGSRGPGMVAAIQQSGGIAFHVAGDTGCSNVKKYGSELSVADAMTEDCQSQKVLDRPAFLYHVGDIVYDFGESGYWYDQFYEPFRNYPGPIFAIPGNHDSFVVPNTPPDQTPLSIFVSNFCAPSRVVTQEAGSLHRTAMIQPGVYFTLDAPFVRIIGLFSNALEDPGVISSEEGKWPVPDFQLDYLHAQLQRMKAEKYSGALLIAVHHPPFSYIPPKGGTGGGGPHSSSAAMLGQIDAICMQERVYPHAVISGHAHNYQRYIRSVALNGTRYDVPFLVCGNGGHNSLPLVSSRGGSPATEPNFGDDVTYLDASSDPNKEVTLDEYDDSNFGYLTVKVDTENLKISYNQVAGSGVFKPAVVDLSRTAFF